MSLEILVATTPPTKHCPTFKGKVELCTAILAVKGILASLSLIGCLFMILTIWLFRNYKISAQRLILYLSIAAMFDSIAYIMNGMSHNSSYCQFQAWMTSYFNWCVLMWVCCIAFNLYMNGVRMTRMEKYEWVYHVVSWGVPGIISVIPFIGNAYGPAGLWCWIIDDWRWMFGIWYCPVMVIIVALVSFYIFITIQVNNKIKKWEGTYDPDVERNKIIMKENVKPLKWYPFVYLALTIFPLINRIQNAIDPRNPVFALVLLHAISSPLQGVFNAVIFGMDAELRSRLTLDQIRLAIQSRREKTIIQEYPESMNAAEETNSQQDNADRGVINRRQEINLENVTS